ncbi:hypothetical protein P171DRAFT_505121 [Karstenula rhodostoma CBS 690.94]|uniref:Uncharacterized protein n=1 Tax=Karstenula rhodostoma CBS 690.94 TaxID=1392251 RepID=A0A9P4P818_9PLEO|nr:hypothetical protein P171DRAFT_505121 [Karstenula rhodostoma CBS 690.94]
MSDSSQPSANHGAGRRHIFDLPAWFPVRPEPYCPSRLYVPQDCNTIFDFFGLPAELRNMIYAYAVTSIHDPDGGRVCLVRQKPGEFRDFTGLPLVCKTIQKEYTIAVTRNTSVIIRAEEAGRYIETFYPDRDNALKQGDIQISYVTYGEPHFAGIDPNDNATRESFKLDVLQLLQLQCRLPWMRVSFLCYCRSFINDKPMWWDQLTDDFNELFSAAPVQGPVLPGAGPLPSILPGMVDYFANKTDYEISVNSRWPKPAHTLSGYDYHPAIVFNVKFNASKNPDMPFSEHWRNKSDLKRLAQTFWVVDEMIEVEEDRAFPRYNIDDMCALLHRTGVDNRGASEWFINLQRDFFSLDPEEASTISENIREASKVDDDVGYSATD